VVEVYPATALFRWGLRSRQYKQEKNLDLPRELVDCLLGGTIWLAIDSSFVDLCTESDDALDALVARAVATGLVDPIALEDFTSALREVWIAIAIGGSLYRSTVGWFLSSILFD
jgi:hypothetical protein